MHLKRRRYTLRPGQNLEIDEKNEEAGLGAQRVSPITFTASCMKYSYYHQSGYIPRNYLRVSRYPRLFLRISLTWTAIAGVRQGTRLGVFPGDLVCRGGDLGPDGLLSG